MHYMRRAHIDQLRAWCSEYPNVNFRVDARWAFSEIDRLRGFIQYALDGPDDPAALKTVLQDALDGLTDGEDIFAFRKAHGRAIPAWWAERD